MIKNIIFDIGNVLTVFAWEEFVDSFGYSGEIKRRIARATVLSPAWNEYDRGVLSDEEVLGLFIANDPELEQEIREVNRDISGILKRCDYAIPWIEALRKRGFKVYYLSNFFRKAELECAQALDFISHMDGGILSYKEKLIKPDEAIYRLLTERYGLNVAECVFLDDKEENCDAAKSFGMHVIRFRDQKQAAGELENIIS